MKHLSKFSSLLVISVFIISCNINDPLDSECHCENNPWQADITYREPDIVFHNDTCWEAFAQGRGIIPSRGNVHNDIFNFYCE